MVRWYKIRDRRQENNAAAAARISVLYEYVCIISHIAIIIGYIFRNALMRFN